MLVIRLTALFLATKTVNTPISCSDFAHYIGKGKISTDSILQLEFFLSQNLRFEFSTHPAHRATWGIYLDIQVCMKSYILYNYLLINIFEN